MRLKDLLADAAKQLDEAGVEDARLEARRLVCWAAGVEMGAFLTVEALGDAEAARFCKAVEQRVNRTPLSFITGERGFWEQTYHVDPSTLIPRADSETLIEALLREKPNRTSPYRILDLGTGTGCLLLTALSLYPDAQGIGIDRSEKAAITARRNAARNQLETRASFVVSDWACAVSGRFDVILCNPPYIKSDDIAMLMPEVRAYEALSALDGGESGLDGYRIVLEQIPHLLSEGGIAIFELGRGQGDDVARLASLQNLHERGRYDDLGGLTRAIVFDKGKL